jgi:hypothetical protein
MSFSISDSSETKHTIWQAPERTCPKCQSAVVADGLRQWCASRHCYWPDAPADSAADSAEHGIQKSERYEAHGLSETVAVTRADEEREIYLLEIAHEDTGYELTREQADALKECLRLALDQHS